MLQKMPDTAYRNATPEEKERIEIDLEWLQQRVIEDDNGCWVWKGFITKGNQPQVRITVAPKVSATMLVRRLVAKMNLKGKSIPLGLSVEKYMQSRQASALEACSWGCCHPDHVKLRTKKQAMYKTKGVPLPLAQRMRISAARSKNSRISDAVIQQIINDPRPGNKVAAELGVHASYVPHVRTGKLRAYSAMGGGLFSGLMVPANSEAFNKEQAA